MRSHETDKEAGIRQNAEKEAAEAKVRLKSVADILHRREKEKSRKKFAEWVALMVTGSVGKLHDWSKEVAL